LPWQCCSPPAPQWKTTFSNFNESNGKGITVTAEGDESITSVQAQVKLTNVNTRQVTTVADFIGTSATVELLRGAYQIDIEGVATCVSPDNATRMRQFRCQSDYEEFVTLGINEVTLRTIFLD